METILKIRTSKHFRLWTGLLLSLLTLYLAARNVSFSEVWQILLDADWVYVWLTLLVIVANTLAKNFRWQVLMGERGRQVGFWRFMVSLLAGQMINTIFPARVGEISRAYAIGILGPGTVFVLGTLALEKLLDMLAYGLLVLILLLLIPLPTWIGDSVYLVLGVSVAVALMVYSVSCRPWVLAALLERLIRWVPWFGRVKAVEALNAICSSLQVLQSRSGVVLMAWWSMVVWGTAILTNHLALLALGIKLPLAASLLVLVILQAGITVPSVPGRFGVFQYACVLALSFFGVQQTLALGYGILMHTLVLGPSTLLGVACFFWVNLGSWSPKRDDPVGIAGASAAPAEIGDRQL